MGWVNPGRNLRGHLVGSNKKSKDPSPRFCFTPTQSSARDSVSPYPTASSRRHGSYRSSSIASSRKSTLSSPRRSSSKASSSATYSSTGSSPHRTPRPLQRRPKKSVPPQRRPLKPTLTNLPTELLQNIFLLALNPSLAVCAKNLNAILTGRHLRLRYLHSHKDDPEDLTRIFTARFLTSVFLLDYEAHFREQLDAKECLIPARLLGGEDLQLVELLYERGAKWGKDRNDTVLEGVYAAIKAGENNVVETILKDKEVDVDTECLRLAIEANSGPDMWTMLADRGAKTDKVSVWKTAIKAGAAAVEWLSGRSAPPGEVLGSLIKFWETVA
ncbi:hypothetical protein BZA77DRAFT_326720 [Pyronema omphalodes]|nr:hypothetical protein BZA77DRAFT_326720 [Pyronema omphalodes]